MPNIKVNHADFLPICPHCEKELPVIVKVEHGTIEQHIVYACPHCRKVLSVGYNSFVDI